MYMAAAQMGVDALTGAKADAVGAAVYQKEMALYNATQTKDIHQRNIASIKQDKILSDTQIQLNQDQAEAQAKVMAAAEGVEGGSVDAVLYETEKNAAYRMAENANAAEAAIEAEAAAVGGASLNMAGIQRTKIDVPSIADSLLNNGMTLAASMTKSERGQTKEAFDSFWGGG